MRALVVIAHPVEDSFCQATAARVVTGLRTGGHGVDVIDLYEDDFRAAMSLEERIAYHTDAPIVDAQVADHVTRLRRAEIVVFVYPTWWAGMPAILKGWFDRVLVPGVGFEFDERTGKVKPALTQVRHLVGEEHVIGTRAAVLFKDRKQHAGKGALAGKSATVNREVQDHGSA